jgi:signal transduction histidine kinase
MALCSGLSVAQQISASVVEIRSASLSSVLQTQTHVVTLPHRWDKSFPRKDGTASYVLTMPALKTASQELALYIPRLGNQVNIYLQQNGQKQSLANFGRFSDRLYDAAKSPRWISLPRAMLQTDQAWELIIETSAQSGRYGGLSSVHYGEASRLRDMCERNFLWRQTTSMVIVVALGLLGILAAGLWWKQREISFALFGLTALLGMVRMSDRLIEDTFIPWPWWGGLMATAYAWHLLLMIRFSLQTAGVWNAALRRGFWLWMIATATAALLSFAMRWPWLWTATLLSLALPAVFTLIALLRRWKQAEYREAKLLAICGLFLIGVGLRDFLVVRLASGSELSFSYMPMALFAFVLTMAWIIIERYSRKVNDYLQLNATLEQRVVERDKQLKTTYEQLKSKDQEQAMLAERARIMRDIHDGVGAQLVGLVGMLRSGGRPTLELHEHAQAALDELRMAVDSLQPMEGSLATVLATLRYRLGPRLSASGIQIQWDVDELPKIDNLTPSAVLQVQRILLEAFTNVIRHSGASVVQVSARHLAADDQLPQRLSLCVDDDGKHLQKANMAQAELLQQSGQVGAGQGLSNMQWRAQAINAQLYLENSPLGGTRVRLEWPLPA